jgi:hypothetical protein
MFLKIAIVMHKRYSSMFETLFRLVSGATVELFVVSTLGMAVKNRQAQ